MFRATWVKYGVKKHKVATPYHLKISGQAKISNREIKAIISKNVNAGRKDWSKKLDDALWAYQTSFKIPIGLSPYQLFYHKACHLPTELEHKALWALKRLNLNWNKVVNINLGQLNEMDELRLGAYDRANLYKEMMKKYHDRKIEKRVFKRGDLVFFFNSRLKLFLGMLKSKWSSPFKVSQVYSSRVLELENEDGSLFKVNRQRVKLYVGPIDSITSIDNLYLDKD
ncbi:uncharacterized protein LOC124886582 [Capsicum annuum]|uniref:uncharacterized protein LOC124886582 n=1 Tax=Capsicum annuum TaxID=4072 RepID=UPI001FB0F987|nr:uncharacterized protein LOC124886582 [Capsicum annuum]